MYDDPFAGFFGGGEGGGDSWWDGGSPSPIDLFGTEPGGYYAAPTPMFTLGGDDPNLSVGSQPVFNTDTGGWEVGGLQVSAPAVQQEASVIDSFLKGAGATLDAFNKAISTPAGRIAAGLLGLGATSLFAKPPQYPSVPQLQQSGITGAGQAAVGNAFQQGLGPMITNQFLGGGKTLENVGQLLARQSGRELETDVEQAPWERMTRQTAVSRLPGFLPTGQVSPLYDPIHQMLQQETAQAFSDRPDPILEQAIAKDEAETRARLHRQLGEDYDLSSPGIQSLSAMEQRHEMMRFQARQEKIARLEPREASRFQFAQRFPEEQLTSREGVRRGSLQDLARLSDFGRQGAAQMQSTGGALQPTSYLLGDPNRFIAQQAQMEAMRQQGIFNQEAGQQEALAKAIGGIIGAGTAPPPRDYMGELIKIFGEQRGVTV